MEIRLPLSIDDDGEILAGDGAAVSHSSDYGIEWEPDYAAFIVRACNAHDDLVAALELALDVLDNHVRHYLTSDTWNDIYCPSAVTEARAALAKAKGE